MTTEMLLACPIDSGFFRISTKMAKMLAGGELPGVGRERLVTVNDVHYWLARTIVRKHNGQKLNDDRHMVWSVREALGVKLCTA